MPLEFRRHAQDRLVQNLKKDTLKPRTLTGLMHSYADRGPGLYKERAKAARKKFTLNRAERTR